MSRVQIQNADKYYNRGRGNQIHVLDHISLELPESGMVAVFGRSGCGKTTLLNVIGGLDTADSGEVRIDGREIHPRSDYLRNRHIGYIFQNYYLNLQQTVAENVENALLLCGMTDREEIERRVRVALANVGMEKFADRIPDTLSGGQQQRVAIARAIVKNPSVILADEPTGNLDEANTVLIMDILKEISRTHLVILVTHEANLVDYYCARVIELSDGKMVGMRVNRAADGYTGRNKNDIYLGELPQSTGTAPGVEIAYYGELPAAGEAPLRLRVVRVDGKMYLQSDTPVQWLTESSEVHLCEGTFKEQSFQTTAYGKRTVDLSALPPLEEKPEKKYGKLFHTGRSVREGFCRNFLGKQKKSKRMLRATLVMLAVVLVFMTSAVGVDIKYYFDLQGKHNSNAFYLALRADGDYSALSGDLREQGIDYMRIIGGSPFADTYTLEVSTGNYMTANLLGLEADGTLFDASLVADATLLAGEKNTEDGGVLLSSALADQLLKGSTYSHIASYRDLIGRQINPYSVFDRYTCNATDITLPQLYISGVVQTEDCGFYMNSLLCALATLQTMGVDTVSPASMKKIPYAESLSEGEVIYFYDSQQGSEGAWQQVGTQVTLLGKPYTIASIWYRCESIFDYPDYLSSRGTKFVLPYNYAKEHPALSRWDAQYSWVSEVYLPYWKEFAGVVCDNSYDPSIMLYISAEVEDSLAADLASLTPYYTGGQLQEAMESLDDVNLLYAGLLYEREFGMRPTREEASAYASERGIVLDDELSGLAVQYADRYEAFLNSQKVSERDNSVYAVSDADLITLSKSVGESDESACLSWLFMTWNGFDGETQYQNYMMIHASDLDAATAYLQSAYEKEQLLLPSQVFDELIATYRGTILSGIVAMAVVIGLICLCLFFIMRANFMSRIKEIGIMRAIGVSKRNLVYRFAVETTVVVALTAFVGYLLSALFLFYAQTAPYADKTFFFPPWLAISLLVLLLAVSVFCGILPVILLLRKTPSQILSKYDV